MVRISNVYDTKYPKINLNLRMKFRQGTLDDIDTKKSCQRKIDADIISNSSESLAARFYHEQEGREMRALGKHRVCAVRRLLQPFERTF